jgi:pyruvate, orthophosphate dikinase
MSQLGLPVPAGFVIGTDFCSKFIAERRLPESLKQLIDSSLGLLQGSTGLTFGGRRKPLLVSVRAGAAVSMPGMMDTLLNIGLNDETVAGMIRMTGNPRFAWDSYRRLIQAYAEIVHHCPAAPFETALQESLRDAMLSDARDLDSRELSKISRENLGVFEDCAGASFPQDARLQLEGAIEAVFRSWESSRAIEYRSAQRLGGLAGTAVIVQMMVFGNMGSTSGSGVAFTRNPVSGEDEIYMDFLFNVQGEDVVSGRQQLSQVDKLASVLPSVYSELELVGKKLELEFRDMQDFEFTVQEGKLYLLQSRAGKGTSWAALKIAVDLVKAGVIDPETALKRLDDYDLSKITKSKLVVSDQNAIASGISASQGVASGEIAFDSSTVQERSNIGKSVILVREDTSTSDIGGMMASVGIMTRLGGRTAHAAVVARQLDKVCIVGCKSLSIDVEKKSCSLGGRRFVEGDSLSLDGNTGLIYEGVRQIVVERPEYLLAEVEKWKNSTGILNSIPRTKR